MARISEESVSSAPRIVEYLRLPDEIVTGRFDAAGERSDEGNLFISVKDTAFIWGAFSTMLGPGQRAEMLFTNAPGTFLVGVSFTEWNPQVNEPTIGSGVMTLVSAERGEGRVRVSGRNDTGADVFAAVGIVVADDASYKEA